MQIIFIETENTLYVHYSVITYKYVNSVGWMTSRSAVQNIKAYLINHRFVFITKVVDSLFNFSSALSVSTVSK